MLSILTTALALSQHQSGGVIVGDFRVAALSSTLFRVEPKGPMGFEDRTTFMVVDRDWAGGVPLTQKSKTATTVTLATADYTITLDTTAAPSPTSPTCTSPLEGMDVSNPARSKMYGNGYKATAAGDCCAACDKDPSCTGWVYASPFGTADEGQMQRQLGDVPGANCWPLSGSLSVTAASDRAVGCKTGVKCISGEAVAVPKMVITSVHDGEVVYNTTGSGTGASKCPTLGKGACHAPCFWDKDSQGCEDLGSKPNLLQWPSPLATKAYGLVDYPRFFVPDWGATPIPAGEQVDPALVETSGYDFRNNVNGDTYIFLLGDDLDSWHASRREFVKLAGPTPVLPDYAFGTWFTWWHGYSEEQAKSEVEQWETDKLPIDIWALDMNWRNTSKDNLFPGEVGSQDHYYDHPNSNLFKNFTEWFAYLKDKNLRTYFNDHPFPVASRNEGGLQTSPEETKFRWNGLSEWMARGLTFWWFDHNWGFSIPPPFVNTSVTSGVWDGLDNAAWGSHVYFSSVARFDKDVRDKGGNDFYQRPMTLTKFGLPDWRPGMPSVNHQESPAQHRFPVWWTGDGVPLAGSVESMVDSGVHDFKPYVHSDCGGDYRPKTGGDLLRWTAHCAFGTIHRFHGSDHRPWTYTAEIEDTIRSYLNTRYKLAPSIIAAGHLTAESGFPFVTRGDLFWPEVNGSNSRDQYIFINDTLVAPISDSSSNLTSRQVWVPPGDWEDAWSGASVTGPKTITATQPYEQQPMWHRQQGGLTVTTANPGLRVANQDWSELVLEAYPSTEKVPRTTRRSIFMLETSARTELELTTDGTGKASLAVSAAADGRATAYVVRLHLRPEQRVVAANLDGSSADALVAHIAPLSAAEALSTAHFPFGGVGTAPAPLAGHIAEIRLETSAKPRALTFEVV